MQRFGVRRIGLTIAVLIGTLVATPVTAQTPPSAIGPNAIGPVTALAPAVRVAGAPVETPPPGRALLISDSAWLGFKLHGTMDSVQGFEHTLALASCRRRVATSCTNYDGFVPITLYDELDDHPDGYATLIVATGYNDSDANFTSDIEQIVTRARSHGYDRVVWLTLRANVSYQSPDDSGFAEVFERSNATLRRVVDEGTYPDLVIADWAAFARDQPGWFNDDGIHLRRSGTYAAGDYISRKMAFLDAQPCPEPAYAGVEPLDPCPDPDAHGPVIDLDSLYPLDARGPDAGFQLSWEGSGSWPDPPWWAR